MTSFIFYFFWLAVGEDKYFQTKYKGYYSEVEAIEAEVDLKIK